jgi:hypothetical protein
MKFEGARARNFVEQKKKNCSYFGIFWVSGGCKKKFGPKIGFLLNWSSHPSGHLASGIPTVKYALKVEKLNIF